MVLAVHVHVQSQPCLVLSAVKHDQNIFYKLPRGPRSDSQSAHTLHLGLFHLNDDAMVLASSHVEKLPSKEAVTGNCWEARVALASDLLVGKSCNKASIVLVSLLQQGLQVSSGSEDITTATDSLLAQ